MTYLKFLLLPLLALTGSFYASEGPGHQDIILDRPGKPYQLEVRIGQGCIHIEGYNGKSVALELNQGKTGSELVQAEKDLTITQSNNVVTIVARDMEALNNLMLKIPSGSTSIKLTTRNKGDITADNVSGALELNHHNGSILLTNITGSVIATTLNGRIEADFKAVYPGSPMAFSTINGDIELTLPAKFKANAKLKTPKGKIKSDFDLNINGSPASDGWTTGLIGGGGPALMLSSAHGDLILHKAH